MVRIQTTEPSAKLSPKGEQPCILVYSSHDHVGHIKRTLDDIEEFLENNGFRILYLKDEARDLSIYSDEFLRAAKDCVLGVVILDGFRPNVLFEFGVLIGMEKPVVLLKDKEAEINIKTLYGEISGQNCRKKTGLSASNFDGLKNPLIEMVSCSQFSDLSMKISEYDHEASKKEDRHICRLLSSNIDNIRTKIEKEGEKILRGKAPASMSDLFLDMYLEYVARLNGLALSPVFEEKDVDSIFSDFKNLEAESGLKMPSRIYSQIASLYKSAGEREENDDS
jgi:nucleoside 2-deoxyribosyltransferase